MKTLFGERKSVKTLAFILALALILPLLPVMSVFGLTVDQTYTVTFEGVSENGANGGAGGGRDYVLFADSNGSSIVQSYATSSYKSGALTNNNWGSISQIKAQYDEENHKVTLSGESKALSLSFTQTEFVFKVIPWGLSEGEYVICMKDGEGEDQIIQPKADGNYHISLANLTNPSITISAKKASTVSFPNEVVAATYGYSLGKVNYGDNLLVANESGKVEFTVTPSENGKEPVVTVITTADGRITLTNGAPSDNTYTYELDLNEVHKDVKKVEIALKTRMLTVTPPTANDAYKVTNLADKVPYGSVLSFDVIVTDGFDVPTVQYTMGTTSNKTLDRVGTTYTIPRVTGDVTIAITAGKEQKFQAQLVVDAQKATIDTETASRWTNITYNQSRDFKVKPTNGYKVTSITVKSGNDILASNTNSDTIHVSNITSDLRVEVTTEPITVTVKINNAGDLTGSYAFKYGELNGFKSEWVDWENGKNQFKVNESLEELLAQIGVNANNPTRFGFDFYTDNATKGVYKGWIIANESLKINPNADTTITLTATWKPDFTELFVLKTSVKYDNALKTLSFTSTLAVNDLADDEAKKTYTKVKVSRFGIFYGENTSTLSGDPTTINTARDIIGKGSTTYEDGQEVTEKFLGSGSENNRIFFYFSNPTKPVDFLVSGSTNGNTITENFKETEIKSRSAITWIEIQLDDGTPAVIVGPATSYNA